MFVAGDMCLASELEPDELEPAGAPLFCRLRAGETFADADDDDADELLLFDAPDDDWGGPGAGLIARVPDGTRFFPPPPLPVPFKLIFTIKNSKIQCLLL